MKKLLSIVTLSLLLFSIQIVPAYAIVDFNTGDNVVISRTVLDDMYILAGNTNVDADIMGDLYIAGGAITIDGNVLEDLVVVGGKVSVLGDVGGDIRVMGGQVTIFSDVGDDIVVAGGTVDVSKNSTVGGTILIAAGYLAMDGHVKEEIWGVMGALILNGTVDGDVEVTIEDALTISPFAKVGGDLNYSSLLEVDVPPGVVAGKINFNKFEQKETVKTTAIAYIAFKLLTYLSALLLAFLLVLFAPKILIKSSQATMENALKAFAVGVLAMIIAIVGGLILMVTVVGIPIALIVFSGVLVIYYLSQIYVSAWLAGYFINFKKRKYLRTRFFFGIALALLAYNLVSLIPLVGWIFNLVLFLVGAGSLLLIKKDYIAFLRAKKMI